MLGLILPLVIPLPKWYRLVERQRRCAPRCARTVAGTDYYGIAINFLMKVTEIALHAV